MDQTAWRRAVLSFVAVLCFVPFGAILHELGHFVPEWALGLDPVLHYASVTSDRTRLPALREYVERIRPAMEDPANPVGSRLRLERLPPEERARIASLRAEIARAEVITRGLGPVQNALWGTLGIALVAAGRRWGSGDGLRAWAWGGATLATMWFRPIMNLPGAVVTGSVRGDEAQVVLNLGVGHLHLPLLAAEAVVAATCLIGTVALLPRADRAPWVVGAALGGGVGVLLWHNVVGPVLLP